MTDAPSERPSPRAGLFSGRPLRRRLAVAFLAVTFAALALLLAVALGLIRADVARFSRGQTHAIERGFARALAAAYESDGRWSASALKPVVALADSYEAQITVRATDGTVIVRNALPAGDIGRARRLPIEVRGDKVATLTMRLSRTGAVRSNLRLQNSLVVAVAISSGLAALAAVAASVLVAAHVVRPVNELTAAARSLTEGKWDVRVEHRDAPEEVNELGEAFNSLATSLEREDALRRALTADIAHELRTPLAVLQVSIESLLDGLLPADTKTIQSLRDETIHLSQVVEDLERLAEAEAGVLHLEHRPIRLDALVSDVLAEFAAVAEASGRRLTSDASPVVVVADEHRLRQVMTNLLTNAVKFTTSGDAIHVRVGPHDGREAEIVVEDMGVGIAPEHLPHIFERFWRSPDAAEITGSGIGLAIVKQLVEAHHGTVGVESQPGRGSRFTVVLPAVPQ